MAALARGVFSLALAMAFVLAFAVIAQDEVVPYKVGDYLKYRVEIKHYIPQANQEGLCRWILELVVVDINYPYVDMNVTVIPETGDPEVCGEPVTGIVIRCRVDLTPENPLFEQYSEFLIDPEYTQRYRVKGGGISETVFEYKKGVLVYRFSRTPTPLGYYETTIVLLDTSIDLGRPSILWILAIIALGAGFTALVLKLARRMTTRREAEGGAQATQSPEAPASGPH